MSERVEEFTVKFEPNVERRCAEAKEPCIPDASRISELRSHSQRKVFIYGNVFVVILKKGRVLVFSQVEIHIAFSKQTIMRTSFEITSIKLIEIEHLIIAYRSAMSQQHEQ